MPDKDNVNVRVKTTGARGLKRLYYDFKKLTQAADKFTASLDGTKDAIIPPRNFNSLPATLAEVNSIFATIAAITKILDPILNIIETRPPLFQQPPPPSGMETPTPPGPTPILEPPPEEQPPAVDEEEERKIIQRAFQIRTENTAREYNTRSRLETDLVGTSLDDRLAAIKIENDARTEGVQQAGDLFSGAMVNAIRGRDVSGAFSNLFYGRLQDIFSNMIGQALSMVPGAGGLFGALFSWLPFAEGGIFDNKIYPASKGRIFRPRRGGYTVVAGEAGKREAFIPDNRSGERLLTDHVINWFPNIRAGLGAAIGERMATFPRAYPILQAPVSGYGGGQGNVEAPVVPAPEVTVVVKQLDPQRITAAKTIAEASYAKARTQG